MIQKKITVYPSKLSGVIVIPGSKSQTMRALVFASLAQGTTVIRSFLPSPDTEAMIRAISLKGSQVMQIEDTLTVIGHQGTAQDVIHAGNSGQILRFIGATSALMPSYTVITGDASIRQRRPVAPLLEGLTQLGAYAISLAENDHAPILIKGPLKGGVARICGSDSQPVSGLLIAAAFAKAQSEIHVYDSGETPWIDLTLSWLTKFSIPFEQEGYSYYKLLGNSLVPGFDYTVPGDWSSALYPIAAAIITQSEITVKGVDLSDPQGDKQVIFLLEKMGAKFTYDEKNRSITIHQHTGLYGQVIDIAPFVDAITLLAVVACYAKSPTHIIGGKITRFKECDRIHAIVTELKKMGACIEETEDGMIIYPSQLYGADVRTYHDHRMALALSVAALQAKGPTTFDDADIVNKSFPLYFEKLKALGAHIE